jgi:hypothetical protein
MAFTIVLSTRWRGTSQFAPSGNTTCFRPPRYRRALEVALVSAEQLAGFSEVTDKEKRQEVGFVYDLVKPKRLCLVEPRPCEQLAQLRYDAT